VESLDEKDGKMPPDSDLARAFAPIEGPGARVLILGSVPGVASLKAHRYYAHPRNTFWPIVLALLDGERPSRAPGPARSMAPSTTPSTTPSTSPSTTPGTAPSTAARKGVAARLPAYETRTARLISRGIALWDVLAECERPGSLDAAIRRRSERPNDLPRLIARHPGLALIAFNGQAAAKLFDRHVGESVRAARPDLLLRTLPSTSPANAASTLADKYARWHAALAPTLAE